MLCLSPAGRDPPRKLDAALAVVHAEHGAGPAGVAQAEEQGAVAGAEVEERGGCLRGGFGGPVGVRAEQLQQRGLEEVDDLVLRVRVVEPVGARVGRVGGVVGELGVVQRVPAVFGRNVQLGWFLVWRRVGMWEGREGGDDELFLGAQLGRLQVGRGRGRVRGGGLGWVRHGEAFRGVG